MTWTEHFVSEIKMHYVTSEPRAEGPRAWSAVLQQEREWNIMSAHDREELNSASADRDAPRVRSAFV